MEVYTVPWQDTTEVLWDESTCERGDAEPAPVGAPEDAEVDQSIVDLAMTQLSYGDCQKNNVKVQNFKKQVCIVFQ